MAAPSPRRVVVTGLGLITALGHTPAAFWDALSAGRSGVGPLKSFDPAALPVRIAGEVRDFDPKKVLVGKEERKSIKMMARAVQMGVCCAKLAFADSGVDRAKLDSTRFGIEVGSSLIPTGLDDIAAAARIAAIDDKNVNYVAWGQKGIPEI